MCDVTVLHRQRLDLLCCCSHTANSLPHYVMSTPACVLLRSPQAFPLHALLAMTTTICIIPVQWQLSFSDTWIILFTRDLRSFEIRFEFESAVQIRFDSKVMGRFQNFRIGRACPLLVVVKWLKPLTALAQYRLDSSVTDHRLLLFNISEEWNEKICSSAHLFCFIYRNCN